ncbi:permease [Desulfomonile tiedjei]|uniref:Putative permease n=1 Tax=Desulfomonile tiedjei (strain ATCC 49306 / DSM 6799 / DCB-1) TaxID=706587 RepID=I4CEJ3_DESTA|nr:permease [Desulfomonile tiedjei]AFM27984.1 putative permease [Desulfomonile tiedjei DSM 6799]
MAPEKKFQTVDAQVASPSRSLVEIVRESHLLSYWQDEWKPLALIIGVFLACYYIPVGNARFDNAVMEAFHLVKWYAQEHVLLCLVPAFFIAGAIGVFVSQEGVMKYLGPTASKWVAYPVASVSGTVLAVCSCTILPLFAGIWTRGAGLGPASAFLYSGPAINVLAIILSARILGLEIGIARAVGAVTFSVVIGLLMHLIFRKEEEARTEATLAAMAGIKHEVRPLWQTTIYFALMVGVLVFANWGKPDVESGLWYTIYSSKWIISGLLGLGFAIALVVWFGLPAWKMAISGVIVSILATIFSHDPLVPFTAGVIALSVMTTTSEGETQDWFNESWGFAKQIMPLLLLGVLVAGLLLGRPDKEGLIPNAWIAWALGGNSIWSNALASVAGAFMYFATLTEVPIVQGLIGSGMGKGPALALLLAGPALSLPSMLVINSVMGFRKTVVFVVLVCTLSTAAGMIFGAIVD